MFPQAGVDPEGFLGLEFRHFFLQPMDGPERAANTQLALDYCLKHPRWRLSLQTHKILGNPVKAGNGVRRKRPVNDAEFRIVDRPFMFARADSQELPAAAYCAIPFGLYSTPFKI